LKAPPTSHICSPPIPPFHHPGKSPVVEIMIFTLTKGPFLLVFLLFLRSGEGMSPFFLTRKVFRFHERDPPVAVFPHSPILRSYRPPPKDSKMTGPLP